jgi:hypothetical protein
VGRHLPGGDEPPGPSRTTRSGPPAAAPIVTTLSAISTERFFRIRPPAETGSIVVRNTPIEGKTG